MCRLPFFERRIFERWEKRANGRIYHVSRIFQSFLFHYQFVVSLLYSQFHRLN